MKPESRTIFNFLRETQWATVILSVRYFFMAQGCMKLQNKLFATLTKYKIKALEQNQDNKNFPFIIKENERFIAIMQCCWIGNLKALFLGGGVISLFRLIFLLRKTTFYGTHQDSSSMLSIILSRLLSFVASS